ncbi:MAG TPA: hypothetical protein V6C65_04100 [Allocoleopsis sp.]
MPTHLKVRIINEDATHRSTYIQNQLMTSTAMIEALQQEPWFLALREITRRYDAATYNDDGEPWFYTPINSHDSDAIRKLNSLFPGLIQIEEAAAEEVAIAYGT